MLLRPLARSCLPVVAALAPACADGGAPSSTVPAAPAAHAQAVREFAAVATAETYVVPPPPLSEGVFPCSDCHDPEMLPANPKRRALAVAHQEIALRHDEEHRWCLDCHDAADRDRLHLAGGELVEFTESHRLCGQCHGDKYRDWKAGVHGRRTGQWDGAKSYLLCVHCHDAHAPAFRPLAPEPPPPRPKVTP